MTSLTEQAAEDFLADRALSPALPGFVGLAVDLTFDGAGLPAGRRPLRHGFLDVRGPEAAVVSGPPSPGVEVALRRMSDDLTGAMRLADRHAATASPDGAAPEAGVRVSLEAGLGGGASGPRRRWALAHTMAPVLAAAFANTPLRDGAPSGWRSLRQARRRDLPVLPGGEAPGRAWAAYVLDSPDDARRTLRQRLRGGAFVTAADLQRRAEGLRPPVAARGHLELDVVDRQPGTGWRIPAAVIAVLMDDARAAEQAWAATRPLADEPGLWERAARDALTDPLLAAAARECFVAAYAALSRQGFSRDLRDAVADFTDRYVSRGRCPADDILDRAAALP